MVMWMARAETSGGAPLQPEASTDRAGVHSLHRADAYADGREPCRFDVAETNENIY